MQSCPPLFLLWVSASTFSFSTVPSLLRTQSFVTTASFNLLISLWIISFFHRYFSKTCCCERPKRMGHCKWSPQGEWAPRVLVFHMTPCGISPPSKFRAWYSSYILKLLKLIISHKTVHPAWDDFSTHLLMFFTNTRDKWCSIWRFLFFYSTPAECIT